MSQAGIINVAGSGTSVVETLTGNSGGAVSPTANNINTVGAGSITIVGSPGTSTLTTQLTGLTNHSLLLGGASTTLTNLGVATNGQIPIGSAAADPVLATLTAGTGISVTNGAGSITLATTATGGLAWAVNATTTIALVANNGYITTSGSAITATLPTSSSAVGTVIGRSGRCNGCTEYWSASHIG